MIEIPSGKHLILIGGPNGSGKSTLAYELLETHDLTYISADDIAYELNPVDPYSARIQAGKEFFHRLEYNIEQENNILIESTLAGKSMHSVLSRYKNDFNYAIIIVFIFLPDSELCSRRVAIRVEKGGHDVPEKDIERRFQRSLDNFWNIFRLKSHQWYLFYNAFSAVQLVARDIRNEIEVLDYQLFVKFRKMVHSDE